MSAESENVTLFRPVGPAELRLIAQADFRAFPPRLPEQPIFYPVLTEEVNTLRNDDIDAPILRIGLSGVEAAQPAARLITRRSSAHDEWITR